MYVVSFHVSANWTRGYVCSSIVDTCVGARQCTSLQVMPGTGGASVLRAEFSWVHPGYHSNNNVLIGSTIVISIIVIRIHNPKLSGSIALYVQRNVVHSDVRDYRRTIRYREISPELPNRLCLSLEDSRAYPRDPKTFLLWQRNCHTSR